MGSTVSTDTGAITVGGNGQTIEGALLAPNGGVDITGQGNIINGALNQLFVQGFTGNNNQINYKTNGPGKVPVEDSKTFVRLIE